MSDFSSFASLNWDRCIRLWTSKWGLKDWFIKFIIEDHPFDWMVDNGVHYLCMWEGHAHELNDHMGIHRVICSL